MVTDPVDYHWSSYRRNAMGVANRLLTPHCSYRQLGATIQTRTARYRSLIAEALDDESINKIRYGIKKGLPVGSECFKTDIEKNLGQRLGTGQIGRPAVK